MKKSHLLFNIFIFLSIIIIGKLFYPSHITSFFSVKSPLGELKIRYWSEAGEYSLKGKTKDLVHRWSSHCLKYEFHCQKNLYTHYQYSFDSAILKIVQTNGNDKFPEVLNIVKNKLNWKKIYQAHLIKLVTADLKERKVENFVIELEDLIYSKGRDAKLRPWRVSLSRFKYVPQSKLEVFDVNNEKKLFILSTFRDYQTFILKQATPYVDVRDITRFDWKALSLSMRGEDIVDVTILTQLVGNLGVRNMNLLIMKNQIPSFWTLWLNFRDKFMFVPAYNWKLNG